MSVRTSPSGQTAVKHILRTRKLKADDHKHPVNVIHHDEATFGEKLADKISSGIGSWTFLIIQTIAVAIWMAGNRQSQKDRLTLEHAAEEADKAEVQNVEILKAIKENTEVTIQILRHVEALVSNHMAEDAAKVSQQGA